MTLKSRFNEVKYITINSHSDEEIIEFIYNSLKEHDIETATTWKIAQRSWLRTHPNEFSIPSYFNGKLSGYIYAKNTDTILLNAKNELTVIDNKSLDCIYENIKYLETLN